MASEMEPKVRQTYLYDFYGELLNEHQQKIFEAFVFDDLSLGEIAEEQDISRQAVHDMIRRSTKTLEEYENKLHLMERFLDLREKVVSIQKCAEYYEKSRGEQLLTKIRQLSDEIIKEL